MNLQPKINKLIRALNLSGKLYLFNKEQFYSEKIQGVCTVNKLFHLMPVNEYNLLNPDKKKDENKYKFVKVEVISTCKLYEVLIKLVEIYREEGVASG